MTYLHRKKPHASPYLFLCQLSQQDHHHLTQDGPFLEGEQVAQVSTRQAVWQHLLQKALPHSLQRSFFFSSTLSGYDHVNIKDLGQGRTIVWLHVFKSQTLSK